MTSSEKVSGMMADARAAVAALGTEVRAAIAAALGNDARAMLVLESALLVAIVVAMLWAVRATLTAAADIGIGALRVVAYALAALVLGQWALTSYASLTGDSATVARVTEASADVAAAAAEHASRSRPVLDALAAWWRGGDTKEA